jgi:hypothetical protein
MNASALGLLVPALLFCHAGDSRGSAVASGRNWQISIDGSACDAAGSLLTIGARIRYLGRGGVVEAPISQLVDGNGKPYLPKSLVWKGGGRPFAALLATGGLGPLQSAESVEVQLRFEVRDAAGDLQLEFGDVKAFPLTRKATSAKAGICASLLKPGQIQSVRRSRPVRIEGAKAGVRAFRDGYPCLPAPRAAWRMAEAQYPPYLPEQLLVFGRGYLPNARQIELPMGRAAAQSYSYAGLDDLKAIEDAARLAVVADFPAYASGSKYFAFNWGVQKATSANEMYAVGIYAVRPCQN